MAEESEAADEPDPATDDAEPTDAGGVESVVEPEVDAAVTTEDVGGDAGAAADDGAEAEADAEADADTARAGAPAASVAAGDAESAERASAPAEPRFRDDGAEGGVEPRYPEGPPDDEEMPLADHIEEMLLRLAIVSAVAAVVAAAVFPFAEGPITFIWNSVLPAGEVAQPRVYGPLELKLTELKFASLAGFIAALPMFVYQTYRFMRPGLYPHERRYYLAAVPTSLVLAFVGVSFAYFIVLPAIFTYFMYYSQDAGLIAFALRQTFDLILVLMGYMALVFQIPLFIMLAIMMGLTDRAWLQDRRLYFWGAFLGLSFLFSPDPTGMAPIVVTLTMVTLFEGTLALLRWTGN